jgi:fatty acid CoA ligase FadD32
MESASVRGAPGRGVGPATEPYLDANGHIALPEGTNLSALLDKNIVEFADALAYRYVDYSQDPDGKGVELTWDQVGTRSRAIAARLQQVTTRGDRVAILAPQGLDYVTSFFGSIQAANIAVPLFAPELPGHAERLDAVLTDAQPAVVLTTTAVGDAVQKFVRLMPREKRPRIIAVDAIPDSVGSTYSPVTLLNDEVAYLQYTSGSTRTPTGVEITHRAAGTNLLQMVLSIGLEGAADEINGAAVPRHGADDDRLPDPLRRTPHLHVADGVRPQAAALDPGAL